MSHVNKDELGSASFLRVLFTRRASVSQGCVREFVSAASVFSSQTDHRVPGSGFLWPCVFSEIHARCLASDLRHAASWRTIQSEALANKRALTLVHFLDDGNTVCFSKTFTLIPVIQIAFSLCLIHPKNVQASARKSTISKSGG